MSGMISKKSGLFIKYKQAAPNKTSGGFPHKSDRLKGEKKFWKKFYSRVPSKRVAMASRKVFCGARRPFITGIVSLVWDRQQLAEGHTIPGAQWAASMGVSGMAGRHCGDSRPEPAPGICFYSHSAPQDPGHGLARLGWLIPTPAAAGSGRFQRVLIWRSDHRQLLSQQEAIEPRWR